ncbi:MAG: hypothetical protein ABIW46_00170 [Acidimicrobiales bacterium]
MTQRYRRPELLADHHNVSAFRCRSGEQTDWLRRHARQSASTGTTKVFVVTEIEIPVVVAYYAWCMAQVGVDAAPARLRKGPGCNGAPCVAQGGLLARRVLGRWLAAWSLWGSAWMKADT